MAKKKMITKKKFLTRKTTTTRDPVAAQIVANVHGDDDDEPDEPEAPEEEAPPEPSNPFNLAGSPERGRGRIHEICDEMGRTWGTHTAMPLSMATVVNIQRMPIGILEFDFRTGGGIVLGRNNRIKGKKDTLKSTMCLKALASAQRTCRHCKWRLVTDPDTGNVNCRCPERRFWVEDEEDYAWLSQEAALSIFKGQLPEGWEYQTIKGTRTPVLMTDPPPHLKGKRGIKRKPISFAEQYRCEPMRCALYDTEFTTDRLWAEANGVDSALVAYTNARWAEQGLESVERLMLTHEFDFVIIDSTSMMETREHLEDRKVGERGTPAGKQKLMGDFMKRCVAAQVEGGVAARYSPTMLTTSHLTTKGMGFGQRTYLGATDGLVADHGMAMDIKMTANQFIFNEEKSKALYGQFTFKIDKNHCGGAGSTRTEGEIKFWLVETPDHPVGDSNDLVTVMDYARKFGDGFLKEGSGAAKLTLNSDMLSRGARTFSTVGGCKSYLRENPSVYDDLRHRVLEKLIADRASLRVREEGS